MFCTFMLCAILSLVFFFFFKISSLILELETLKKEKIETEEARKTAEEQIESMRKDNEEKVISSLLLTVCLFCSLSSLYCDAFVFRWQWLTAICQLFTRVRQRKRKRKEEQRKLLKRKEKNTKKRYIF